MKLIGLDVSTRITGYSVFQNNKLVEHGVIDFHKEKDTVVRQRQMIKSLIQFLDAHKPDVVFIEDTFCKGNIETSMKLMMMIGSVFGWCVNNDKDFKKIKPSAWRVTVGIEVGNKNRSELKAADIEYVRQRYNLVCGDDEADAICIGEAGNKIQGD